jgi:hypothetical protein
MVVTDGVWRYAAAHNEDTHVDIGADERTRTALFRTMNFYMEPGTKRWLLF